MTLRRLLMLVAIALAAVPSVHAQVPSRLPVRPDTIRNRADSLARRDTTGRDSVPRFAVPPDTVMERLMGLKGYSTTRYQGELITFDNLTRAIQLTKQALVQRDSQLIKSDTIRYAGVGSTVRVGTSPDRKGNVFITPGQAAIYSAGAGAYDLANRRASVVGVRTKIPQSGQELTITGEQVTVVAPKDSLKDASGATYYLRSGTVTACDDSIPDYFFKAGEIKRTGTFVVARPAILYIGDVPVMWLPFLFQDIRNGRHSGLIAPNIGVSDFIRNSKSYRRNVEGLGYYVAISDYIDAQASLDWRSSAGQADFSDPGYVRYNGEFRYRWLDRFIAGNIALSHTTQGGQVNDALSWGHQQSFSRNTSFSMNLNLVKNTTLQRQTTINPYQALAIISSTANYQQKIGPMQLSVGGSQKQYSGRAQRDLQFPTVSLTTSPLNVASWLSWTPSFNYSSSKAYNIDQVSPLGLLLRGAKTAAGIDSVFGDTLKRSSYTSNLSFDTPITIFGYNLGNSFQISSALNAFPEREIVTDVETGEERDRIYSQTYHTEVSWNPQFTLPPIARNNFNFSPSLSLQNVDPSAFCLRNERTAGKWVCQSKRLTFGLSASPTMFGLFSGFGPFQRFRHQIAPTISYSYAPANNVSDEFLAAIGRSRYSKTAGQSGYLGALAQNALSFGLATNIEAKLKAHNDSNPESGDKVKLLSVNFTSINYDFERARVTKDKLRGLTTQNFGYTVRSDLLPGFDLGVDYSLFEGSTLSDSAKFSPFRERITSSFQFSNTANPFAVFARMFGQAVPSTAPGTDRLNQPADDRYARQVASQPVAGRAARGAYLPPATKGWQASFTFTAARQRPVTGSNVVQFDPTTQCAAINTALLRLQYEQCVANALANPVQPNAIGSNVNGSTIYVSPPTTSLGSNLSFNLTEHWAASWQTQYDFVQHNFASQVVSLQRDLHDWRAIFAFTQSPNGSFAFNFLISLKAEPDLKFDYHKSTYRNEGF